MKKLFLFFAILLFGIVSLFNSVSAQLEEDNETVTALNNLIAQYVDETATYTKDTKIHLNDEAIKELLVHGGFHADVSTLERTTYYKGSELWMSREDGKYSYYGTAEGNTGVTYADAITPLIIPADAKVVLSGEGKNSMQEYYIGLEDIVAKNSHNWSVVNDVYTSTNAEVIEWFKAFTAPCYLGFTKEDTSNYITLDKVTISVDVDGNLVLNLYATTDAAKFTSKGGVFSTATILNSVWSNEVVANKFTLNNSDSSVLIDLYAVKADNGVYVKANYQTRVLHTTGDWWQQDNIELRFNTPEGKIKSAPDNEQWILSTNRYSNFDQFYVSNPVKNEETGYYDIQFKGYVSYSKLGITSNTPLGFTIGSNPGGNAFFHSEFFNTYDLSIINKITEKGILRYCLEETCSHKYEYEVTSYPTCSEDGSKEGYCLYCNHFDVVAIPSTGEHVYNVEEAEVITPSTCTVKGVGLAKCGCGHEGEVELELDLTNHANHWNAETNKCECGSLVNNLFVSLNGAGFHHVNYTMDGSKDFEFDLIVNTKRNGASGTEWGAGFTGEIFSQDWLNGGWSYRMDWCGWGTWSDGGRASYTDVNNGLWTGKFNEVTQDMDIIYNLKYFANEGKMVITMTYMSNVQPYSQEIKHLTYTLTGITYKGSMIVGFGGEKGDITFKYLKMVSGVEIPHLEGKMNDSVWQDVSNNKLSLVGGNGSLDLHYVKGENGIYLHGYYRVKASVAPIGGEWWQNHNFEFKLLTPNGYLMSSPGNSQWLVSSIGAYRADRAYFSQPVADGEYNVYNIELYISYGRLGITKDTGVGIKLGMNICGQEWISSPNWDNNDFNAAPRIPTAGEVNESYASDLEVVSGLFAGENGSVISSLNNNIALIKDVNMSEGTLSSLIRITSNSRVGLVFGYSNVDGVESYYRFVANKSSQKVEIDKVVNGVATNLYSNYLSAGYNINGEFPYQVIIEDGKAYCYFWNTLYYVVNKDLTGTGVGLYAEGSSAQFRNYEVSDACSHITTDTLLFGHSYFELWGNYKNDLAALATEYDFGDYLNIGIGGSVAAHWNHFKESLVTYEASKAIYMIGINDLTGGTSPEMVLSNIKETLLYMKEVNPELTVVLLSVNHCPARANIRQSISDTNVLMGEFVAQYDWISYAEMEYEFCDDGVNPDPYWFTDGLHPTAAGYIQRIVPAIKAALDGVNQPSSNPELDAKLLADAKELKMCQLTDYSQWSYRESEWNRAKVFYEEAISAIEACQTVEEVETLDLRPYINELEGITSNSDYAYEELRTFKHATWWETQAFSDTLNSSSNGTYNIYHDGHRINNNVLYTDMSFTFSLTDIIGEFPTVGIIFRGQQTPGLGVSGYYINIVTEPNYIQVWYFENCYFSTSNYVQQYIGGWVFPGEVENTEFRTIVEGNMVYIYTEDDYRTYGKNAYGCSVDLTYGGQIKPYTYGGYGILNWSSSTGARGKLTIDNLSGKVATAADMTKAVVNGIVSNQNSFALNNGNIVYKDGNTFNVNGFGFDLYNDVIASDFDVVITPNSTGDVGVAGLLFRTKKNSINDGLDGYLLNFVSNASQQYIQIYYLVNCYNTNGSAVVCDYMGGWVYPSRILGTEFRVRVFGSYLFIETDNHYLGVAICLEDVNHPEYKAGNFGLISWANTQADLTINNLKVYK